MREPLKLDAAVIQAALQTYYGLSRTTLTFLPLGNDSASFVYHVEASDGDRYFLKVRTGAGFSAASLVIPQFLRDHGIPHILAPVPTTAHTLWVHVHDFALSLYPFIDSRTAAATGLSSHHWWMLGDTLHKIHASTLPPDLRPIVPHETFTPSRRQVLTALDVVITNHDLSDPIQHALSVFWRTQQDAIRRVIDRADTLGGQLRQARLPFVVCHADLHTWNVLLDQEHQLWIVDWDETILAPKERDLMFVVGGIAHNLVSAHATTCFLQGYGDAPIDRQALAYYRYAWAVQDMGAYAEAVFFSPDLDDDSRWEAVRGFIDLFASGNIVAIASTSESGMA